MLLQRRHASLSRLKSARARCSGPSEARERVGGVLDGACGDAGPVDREEGRAAAAVRRDSAERLGDERLAGVGIGLEVRRQLGRPGARGDRQTLPQSKAARHGTVSG
jgi:hypothetical protein